jgi:putative Holliday junction resolvase
MLEAHADAVAVGIDPGKARCGVAASDPSGTLASPLGAVPTEPRATLVQRVIELLGHRTPTALAVGLPLDQYGNEGDSAEFAREIGAQLAAGLKVEATYVDERFTTSEVTQRRRETGRKGKQIAGEVDAFAAAAILQSYLDARRLQEP